MKRYWKKGVLLAVLCMSFPVSAAADENSSGVICSKSAVFEGEDRIFWGWDTILCSAQVDENGDIYNIAAEGTMQERIMDIAIAEDTIYLTTYDGLFYTSLDDFGQSAANAQMLYDSMLLDGFQLYDGYVYYRSGSSLKRTPDDRAQEERLLTGVEDYQVTEEGIFYTDEDGGLFFIRHDGSGKEFLTDTPREAQIVMHGDDIYFWGKENARLYCFDLNREITQEIFLNEEFYTSDDIWVTDEYLAYRSTDYDCYKYYFADGSEEALDELASLPEERAGWLQEEILYSAGMDTFYWKSLRDNWTERIKKEDVFGGEALEENIPADFDMGKGAGIGVSEGSSFFSNDYFMLYLPADVGWNYEIINENTVQFFLESASESGYGGKFLSIRAYGWGENGYEEIPRYRIAGLSNDKIYVAIFPTDLQYNPDDPQQAAEYQRVQEFMERIDENSEEGNNPFITNLQ